jgi:hypothetical protein
MLLATSAGSPHSAEYPHKEVTDCVARACSCIHPHAQHVSHDVPGVLLLLLFLLLAQNKTVPSFKATSVPTNT